MTGFIQRAAIGASLPVVPISYAAFGKIEAAQRLEPTAHPAGEDGVAMRADGR